MPSSTGTLVFNDQKIQAPDIYATESLGVGVSDPTSNLEVVGNAYVSSNLQVGTANLFVDTTTGRVGVGTVSPNTALEVAGTIRFSNAGAFSDVYVLPGWVEYYTETKRLASDAASSDLFGNGVAISGDGNTAIVGAYGNDDDGSQSGSAYVFTYSNGSWDAGVKIVAPDAAAGDEFGRSVAISSDGNTAIVGAWDDENGFIDAGAVYIFTRSNGSWDAGLKRVALGTANNGDLFGDTVAISGDGNTAIVGARGKDDAGFGSGSVYVFTRSGGTWDTGVRIVASDTVASDSFGCSVAISGDGNTAIVGAYGNDDDGSSSGSAYIFTRSGGSWDTGLKRVASDAAGGDEFGYSVAISGDGNTAIVGAYGNDDAGFGSGSAYIFTRSGGSWDTGLKIVASDATGGDGFGDRVAISSDGNTAIVGAINDADIVYQGGSAYIFTRSGGTWTQSSKLISSDLANNDRFGKSVGISSDGNRAIVGAWLNDDNGTSSGSAYIFETGNSLQVSTPIVAKGLDVSGTVNVGALTATSGAFSGNLGVGTTIPSAPFHVTATGDTKTTGTPATNGIYVYNPTNSANQDACLAVRVAGSSAGDPFISFDAFGDAGWCLGMDNSDANKFKICNNWYDLNQGAQMTIDTSGNVGIGTTSPGYKLDVNGSIQTPLLNMNGTTMSKAPRVIHIDDTRSGCPPTWAANNPIMQYSLTLSRTAYVYVSVSTILLHSTRADCSLYFNTIVQQYHLTASDDTSWNPVNMTAGGTLGAGTHTIKFQCGTANVVGCGDGWGGMQILVFEQ